MERIGADRKVYLGLPAILFFVGFAVGHIVDLVFLQGDITGLFQGAQIIQLMFGLMGLSGGYMILDARGLIAKGQKAQYTDAKLAISWGLGLFVVMAVMNSYMSGFSTFQSELRSSGGWVIVLAAAPFEEMFFNLLIASVLFLTMKEIVPVLRYTMTVAFHTVIGLIPGIPARRHVRVLSQDDNINRGIAIVLTAAMVGVLFVLFHGAVAPIGDPAVAFFYFRNRFFYTLVYLITGSIMAGILPHFLHNGLVFFGG